MSGRQANGGVVAAVPAENNVFQLNASTSTAANAGEATGRIGLQHPDVALLWPASGGGVPEVLGYARRFSRAARMIVVSSNVDEIGHVACLEAAASHHLDEHSRFRDAARIVTELCSRTADREATS